MGERCLKFRIDSRAVALRLATRQNAWACYRCWKIFVRGRSGSCTKSVPHGLVTVDTLLVRPERELRGMHHKSSSRRKVLSVFGPALGLYLRVLLRSWFYELAWNCAIEWRQLSQFRTRWQRARSRLLEHHPPSWRSLPVLLRAIWWVWRSSTTASFTQKRIDVLQKEVTHKSTCLALSRCRLIAHDRATALRYVLRLWRAAVIGGDVPAIHLEAATERRFSSLAQRRLLRRRRGKRTIAKLCAFIQRHKWRLPQPRRQLMLLFLGWGVLASRRRVASEVYGPNLMLFKALCWRSAWVTFVAWRSRLLTHAGNARCAEFVRRSAVSLQLFETMLNRTQFRKEPICPSHCLDLDSELLLASRFPYRPSRRYAGLLLHTAFRAWARDLARAMERSTSRRLSREESAGVPVRWREGFAALSHWSRSVRPLIVATWLVWHSCALRRAAAVEAQALTRELDRLYASICTSWAQLRAHASAETMRRCMFSWWEATIAALW